MSGSIVRNEGGLGELFKNNRQHRRWQSRDREGRDVGIELPLSLDYAAKVRI